MQSRRTPLVSSKLIKEKKRKRIIFLSIFFSVCVVCVLVLFFVFRAPFLYITDVSVSGNQIIEAEHIKELVHKTLESEYLFVIPKKNRLVYPEGELTNAIQREFGRVEELQMQVNKNTLEIKIKERGSYALWCQTEKECFFIDAAGLVFSQAPVFSGGVYQIFTGIITDTNPLGKTFLDEALLKEVLLITESLLQYKLVTERIDVVTLRETILTLSGGLKIKIDLTKKSEETVKVIKTLFASNEFKKVSPNTSSLEYIDVRFGTKVFFKQKNTSSGVMKSVSTSAF